MKISKLLNKKYFSIILILVIGLSVHAEDQPADIWNIEKKNIEDETSNTQVENSENNTEIKENFELSPRGIREMLNLNKPIYEKTDAYGHFGRAPEENGSFSWEKTNKTSVFSR